MIHTEYCTQPEGSLYTALFAAALARTQFTRIDVAVAYATSAGADCLLESVSQSPQWNDLTKRWLIGVDWCRTEPQALERLSRVRRSQLRVPDGAFVVTRPNCVPQKPFHPKTFILQGDRSIAVISGSGNMSRNGLTRGHEVGNLILADRPAGDGERNIWEACTGVQTWFEHMWRRSSPLGDILEPYQSAYDTVGHLSSPTPTEDDVAPGSITSRRALTAERLKQLRACSHLWIQAGNLHRNRGPHNYGNQLMLSPMTRVFFGFPAEDVPQDTTVGEVSITFDGNVRNDCTLRFSNNSMDVLTLPLPGTAEGPEKYDQEVLLFRRVSRKRYELQIAQTERERTSWKRRSERVEGTFAMTSGREWGVF